MPCLSSGAAELSPTCSTADWPAESIPAGLSVLVRLHLVDASGAAILGCPLAVVAQLEVDVESIGAVAAVPVELRGTAAVGGMPICLPIGGIAGAAELAPFVLVDALPVAGRYRLAVRYDGAALGNSLGNLSVVPGRQHARVWGEGG